MLTTSNTDFSVIWSKVEGALTPAAPMVALPLLVTDAGNVIGLYTASNQVATVFSKLADVPVSEKLSASNLSYTNH